MLPIQFVYTENGKEKSSLDEHKRRTQIMKHNKRLNELYPVSRKEQIWIKKDLTGGAKILVLSIKH